MTTKGEPIFSPIRNPYIVGVPLTDRKMFFGREDDFAFVKNKFSAENEGGLIVLCGGRRYGKTSVLHQIMEGRLGSEFLPVFVDMQAMTVKSDRDFLARVAQEVVSAVSHPKVTMDPFLGKADHNPFEAFEDLVRTAYLNLSGRSLVLMFDEYEIFEANLDSGIWSVGILNLLANLIEHRRVFVIFTGSDKLEARDRPYWKVFLGKGVYHRIGFLTKRDTFRLVQEPLSGVIDYAEGVSETIFNLTAGQPFYTQALCQAIIDRLNECRRGTVTAEDLEVVVSERVENPLPQMIYSWTALTDLERIALSVAAELNPDRPTPFSAKDIGSYLKKNGIRYKLDINELSKSLESLFHCDLLAKAASGGEYSFKMDLWRRWVMRMHSILRVLGEMEQAERPPGKGIVPIQAGHARRRNLAIAASGTAVALAIILYYLWPGLRPPPPAWARLSVETTPRDANVFVGNLLIGSSPVVDRNVPAGQVALRIELGGYERVDTTVDLGKGQARSLAFDLVEIKGNLSVSSTPSGARIRLDGKDTDQLTPASLLGLSANAPHRVELELQGYETKSIDGITIRQNSTVDTTVALSQETGSVTINSTPQGAQVRLDGQPPRQTPCVYTGVGYGRYKLELTMNGYYPEKIDTVVAEGNTVFNIPLRPIPPGRIILIIQPYATVKIDGKTVATDSTHVERDMPPGTYEITLCHSQFPPYSKVVQIRANESDTIIHNFLETGVDK